MKFHVTKLRFSQVPTPAHSSRVANRSELTKIRMLRGFRFLRKSSERTPPRHFSKHFSNASTSGIREQHLYIRCSPRRGIPSSHESLASKHVFRIRISLRHAASVCSRASTRGHAKEIACHSSIEGPTVLSFSRLLLSLSSSLHSPC